MADKDPQQDNILMQIRGEGLIDDDQQGEQVQQKVVYVLHPNCAIEEI